MSKMPATTATGEKKKAMPSPKREWGSSFSADEVIDAYQQGRQKGRGEIAAIVEDKVSSNLDEAAEHSERLFNHLEENTEITPTRVFLRMDSPVSFSALYLVPEDEYVSDAMFEVMKESNSRELEIQSSTFRLDFEFVPYSDSTHEESIVNDGYGLVYPAEQEE